MFGWGKTEDPSASASGVALPSPNGPIIAALLIEGDSFDLTAVQRTLAKARLGGHSPAKFNYEQGFLSFELGDELIAIAEMPAPYPWSDLKGPCETSWMWPKQTPATSVQRHRIHVLITALKGKAAPIPRRLMVTQIVGLAAEMPGVIGVYWPEGTLIHYPPVFSQMARKITNPKAPPLYLWVDFRVFRNADGTSGLFTTGLHWLGHMELEIPRLAMPPSQLREWAVNIAYYLLENGAKIKDGHTIGMSATQQIRVRHRPSSFGARGIVMQLQA